MNRNQILKKTIQVSTISLLSKFLGIMREVLVVRYLGVSQVSDAFVIAYKIPDILKRVLAEGALNMAFIPTLVKIIKDKEYHKANKLMTFLVCILSLFMMILCCITLLFSKQIILFFAPGFLNKAIELTLSSRLLSIFVFFVFFISLASIFAGIMQTKNEFFIPSLGTVWLNIVYIGGLLLSMFFGLSVYAFAYLLTLSGLIQLLFFYQTCKKLGFKFFEKDHLRDIVRPEYLLFIKDILLIKFLPCFFTMSIVGIYFLIDARFASMCVNGSVTLLNLAFKFMAITLSGFSTVLTSLLLPSFSKIMTYAPKRAGFYFLESAKFLIWVTVPIMIFMIFFANKIFYTGFYRFSNNFTIAQVDEAGKLLIGFMSGLLFHSLNRLLVTVCYAKNKTFFPLLISLFGAMVNIFLNFILVPFVGIYALPFGTTIAGFAQSALLLCYVTSVLKISLYKKASLSFIVNCIITLLGPALGFFGVYWLICYGLNYYSTSGVQDFFLNSLGLWCWVLPLFAFSFVLFYKMTKYRHIKIYFLK